MLLIETQLDFEIFTPLGLNFRPLSKCKNSGLEGLFRLLRASIYVNCPICPPCPRQEGSKLGQQKSESSSHYTTHDSLRLPIYFPPTLSNTSPLGQVHGAGISLGKLVPNRPHSQVSRNTGLVRNASSVVGEQRNKTLSSSFAALIFSFTKLL